MVAHPFYRCDECGVGTFMEECWLCGEPTRFVGFRYPHHQRLNNLKNVTMIDLWGLAAEEAAAIEAQLIPCPLCDGEGLIQSVEDRIWAECPHCWGAMYRTQVVHEPFDPRVAPFGYDIAKGVEMSIHRNRIKGDIG